MPHVEEAFSFGYSSTTLCLEVLSPGSAGRSGDGLARVDGWVYCAISSPLSWASIPESQTGKLIASICVIVSMSGFPEQAMAMLQQSTPLHGRGAELAAWAPGTYTGR